MTIQETARQAANRAFLSWEHNDAETLPMDDVADAVALAVLQDVSRHIEFDDCRRVSVVRLGTISSMIAHFVPNAAKQKLVDPGASLSEPLSPLAQAIRDVSDQAPQTQAESPASSVSVEQATAQVLCHHGRTTGGNDYIRCESCDLEWDYRKTEALPFAVNTLITAVRLDQQEQAHAELESALDLQQQNHADAVALIRQAHAAQLKQARAEIERLTKELQFERGQSQMFADYWRTASDERDAARKGLFHRITGWDKDGQTPDQILDELQQLRNTVALLRSKPEVEALAQGLQDFAYGRVVSLTEMDAITHAELVKSQLTEFTEATNDLLAELERTSTGIPDRVIERLREAALSALQNETKAITSVKADVEDTDAEQLRKDNATLAAAIEKARADVIFQKAERVKLQAENSRLTALLNTPKLMDE